ncbi:ribosome maturation factor RimM [Jannaschia sp. LMIT008]|uniref:ribosome maturation factor RimM n=1 Tax=Jannaschia maritima TaxID=3032585 RepID=UPI0028113ECF|nr:ribosome maturation factor RimM [Jannaschia sp. LMIT008]
MKDHVCLGAITGAHGVRGDVRVKSFCADPSAIGDYGPLTSDDGRTYRLTVLRPIKNGYAVRLSGVAAKEAADALRGQRLWVPRGALPDAEDDEYYHADLIGLDALDVGGEPLGRVAAVHDHGAGDLLELRGGPHGNLLIPFTKAAVPTVDLGARRVIVDPPHGTLPGQDDVEPDDVP